MRGLVHIYTGNGKGKTTAALGLALRSAGCGNRVLVLQFMKGRDTGELHSLAQLPNIEVQRLDRDYGFYKRMTDQERQAVRFQQDRMLEQALAGLKTGQYGLIVLDEGISAYRYGLLDGALLMQLLTAQADAERVITGRDAPAELLETADYITDMQAVRHPFQKGIAARKGVEY